MTRSGRAYWSLVGLCLLGVLGGALFGSKALKIVFLSLLGALALIGFGWLVIRLFQKLLWRVGRRLAFSYFLIGIVPIPLLALLFLVLTAVATGFVAGQSYRSSVRRVQAEVDAAASSRLAADAGSPSAEPTPEATFAVYRDGRRVAGDERAPVLWPTWLEAGLPEDGAGEASSSAGWTASEAQRDRLPPILLLEGGDLALGAARRMGRHGVVALSRGPLEREIRRRSGIWIRLTRRIQPEDDADDSSVDFTIGKRRFQVTGLRAPGGSESKEAEDPDSAERFYGYAGSEGGSRWTSYPSVAWGDLSAPLVHAADGQLDESPAVAVMRVSPRAIRGLLFSGNAELRTSVWAALITVTALLFDIYLIALLMAGFMIFGLSRAVNRLYRATESVARGDFSVRIPVRRKDQIGALQRTFNDMAAHLQGLVATAAQKEALENELQVARRLQTSLLPHRLDFDPRAELAAHFEPSAAIGGDYYDLVRLPGNRLVIFVADVSGHGLPAGLRMAMIKAGVNLLAEQGLEASELLAKLDGLVRSAASGEGDGASGGDRSRRREFVTASLTVLDLDSGRLQLTNAGHPPLYVVRRQASAEPTVDEIALPGSALGGLGTSYGAAELKLAPGDCAVWLSDGLIEACDAQNDAFGYDRVRSALRTGDAPAAKIEALLAAVRSHTGERVADDDRTVVALRWAGPS